LNRIEFLSILSSQLQGFTEAEKREILCDYEEHFSSGGAEGKTEEEICRRLGDPAAAARQYVEARQDAGRMDAPPPPRVVPPYRRPERLTFGSTMEAMRYLYQVSTADYVLSILLTLLFLALEVILLLTGASVSAGVFFALVAVPFVSALHFWTGMTVLFSLLCVFFSGLLICGAGAAVQKWWYRVIAGMAERDRAARPAQKEERI